MRKATKTGEKEIRRLRDFVTLGI